MSAATATADVTAETNADTTATIPLLLIKHVSLKEKWQWRARNTRGSLAAVNDYMSSIVFWITAWGIILQSLKLIGQF